MKAAFTACYSDWKLIRTRATVQIVLEIPIEKADSAYQVLGGMPIAGKEIWVAVARLADDLPETDTNTDDAFGAATLAAIGKARPPASPHGEPVTTQPEKQRRRFSSLPLPQQAALLCQEPSFWNFLREHFDAITAQSNSSDDALKMILNIRSKRDIQENDPVFFDVRDKYLAWKRVA